MIDFCCFILYFYSSQRRNFGDRLYTSGRVDTRGKFDFLYGEVEWRAKLPKGKGTYFIFNLILINYENKLNK
jgi:hypothetical protein